MFLLLIIIIKISACDYYLCIIFSHWTVDKFIWHLQNYAKNPLYDNLPHHIGFKVLMRYRRFMNGFI